VVFDAELGARVSRRALTASASAFVRRTRDAIVWFPGTFVWSPRNAGRETVNGAEAHMNLTSASFDGSAWVGMYRTALREGGVTIPTPYVPSAIGGADFHARIARFSLGASMTASSRRPFVTAPRSREFELPGAATVGITAGFTIPIARKNAEVRAGVRDLFDAQIESVRRYPTPGRTWTAGLTISP
jgi:outer membrane cobalamin receptor